MAHLINKEKQEKRINYLIKFPEFINKRIIEPTIFWRLQREGYYSHNSRYTHCQRSIKDCIKQAKKRINSVHKS